MDQKRRNLVLGITAAVLFVAAATLFMTRSGGAADLPGEYAINGICLACRQECHAAYNFREPEPHTCPHCGEQAVYAWRYCAECKLRFVPRLNRPDPAGPLRVPPFARCPVCNSSNVMAYDAEAPDQQPTGDAPLPKWP